MDEMLRSAWNALRSDPTDPLLVERYAALLARSGASAGIAKQADGVMRLAKKTRAAGVHGAQITTALTGIAERWFIHEMIGVAKERFRGTRASRDVEKAEWQNARIGVELLIERGMDPREVAQRIGVAPNTMSAEAIVATLQERELFFDDWESGSRNVVLIPAGWEVSGDLSEVYGYMATRLVSNDDEIETGWLNLDDLALCSVVSEAKARKIHPALFEYLDRINRGEEFRFGQRT